MADEEILDDEQDEDEILAGAAVSGGRSKIITLLMWIAGVVVAVLLMFLIAYITVKRITTQTYKQEQNIVIAPAPPPLATFKFQKEFRVNTADVDEPHFIQLSLAFGFDVNNKELESELVNRHTQMMHIINIILGGKKKEDLTTPLQKLNMGEEIKSQINMILRQGKVEEVYFEELVIS